MQVNVIELVVILSMIWVYMLGVLRREKLTAFHFIIGTSGLFGILFVLFKDILSRGSSYILMGVLDAISSILTWYTVYSDFNIIFINNDKAAISLFVDYECCGLIEMLVVLSIVAFFPLFSKKQKVLYGLFGMVYTMIANIVRLLVITYLIYREGNDFYYIAHSALGRVVFYVLTLVLYFYLVTYSQIKTQHLGSFEYGDAKKQTGNKESKESNPTENKESSKDNLTENVKTSEAQEIRK